ncbi:MAG: cytochrome c oxidase subunit II [Chloroflexota bacterium]
MNIETFEKAFLALGGVLLGACLAALLFASVVMGIQLPGQAGELDPAELATTPPFDQPGVRQVDANKYEVVVIGRAYSFEPGEIRVPAGADVTFIATAQDVLHGFNVEKTRVNLMLIPGQISRTEYTFEEPGEYLVICHEYCGTGHHTMVGKVIVE